MSETPLHESIEQISELLARRRFDHARRIMSQVLPQHPDDEQLLFYAGYIAYHTDNEDEAWQHATRLLEVAPNSYEGRLLMCDVLEQREELGQAERLYLALINDYPDDATLYAAYAMLMLRTLHVEKAGGLAHEALRRDPDHALAIQVSTLAAIIDGTRSERDEHLSDLMTKHPQLQATAATLVQVLQREGRHTEALRVSQEMLRAHPDNQHIVDLVIEEKVLSHWSMKPLWPFMRYGWAASIAVWFGAIIFFRVAPENTLTAAAGGLLLVFVVYSWVWPHILRKIMKR